MLAKDAQPDHANGLPAQRWTIAVQSVPAGASAQLDVDQVVALSGGRVPIGLNPAAHPGPYVATWQQTTTTTVLAEQGVLLDAQSGQHELVTLSGGGLDTPRTLAVRSNDPGASSWSVSDAYRNDVAAQLNQQQTLHAAWQFWGLILPIVCGLMAAFVAFRAWLRMGKSEPNGAARADAKSASA